ncbi:MAG: hypothetical protein IPI18_18200 [Saprospiraceae bacterium]|nr:hypothetical protein [Saprospiraceae bacterium]
MQVPALSATWWRDNDGNGLQGGVGETGIPGVIVTLTYTINSTNFTVLDTTTPMASIPLTIFRRPPMR